MPPMSDNTSPVSRRQITEAYLKALRLIDERVAPLLGKVTTRVLVQVAAKRVMDDYPFLYFFMTMPYTDIDPSIIHEQLSGITTQELSAGLDALLDACFAGLTELTGNIIAPPLHIEVRQHLQQTQQE
ncbi:MAG: hypothetical protein NVS4B11_25740 [Ktedonobacteraceae bacterium]